MSMLSAQCDNLRKMADKIADKGTFVGYGGCVSNDALMHDSAIAMREAANTIEALSAKLQGVIGTRYCELFGTPERAAKTWLAYGKNLHCSECPMSHDDRGNTCELPKLACVWYERHKRHDVLTEWLKGKSDE